MEMYCFLSVMLLTALSTNYFEHFEKCQNSLNHQILSNEDLVPMTVQPFFG